jgi:hypothetical protein
LLEFSVATEIDYADIFRYQTASELIQCPNEKLNPFEPTCPVEKGPLGKELTTEKEDKRLALSNFDNVKNKELPDNYNLVDGWWLDRQKEIIRYLDVVRLA